MLGNNINKIRKSRRLTLDSCAKLSGLTPDCFNDIETGGIKKPTRYILENIAYALAVETSYLNEVNLDLDKIDDFLNIPQEYLDTYKVPIKEKREFIEYLATFSEQVKINNNFDGTTNETLERIKLVKKFFWEAKALNKRK